MNEHVLLAMQSIDIHTEVSVEQLEQNRTKAESAWDDAHNNAPKLDPEKNSSDDYIKAHMNIAIPQIALSVCTCALTHGKHKIGLIDLVVRIADYFKLSDEDPSKYWGEIVNRRDVK